MVGKKAEKPIAVSIIGIEDCKYHFLYENEIYSYSKRVRKEVGGYIQKNLDDTKGSGFLCKPRIFSLAFIPQGSEYRELGNDELLSNEVIVFKNIWTYFLYLVSFVL